MLSRLFKSLLAIYLDTNDKKVKVKSVRLLFISTVLSKMRHGPHKKEKDFYFFIYVRRYNINSVCV